MSKDAPNFDVDLMTQAISMSKQSPIIAGTSSALSVSFFLKGGVLNITFDPLANDTLPVFHAPTPINSTFLTPLILLNAGSVNITLGASSVLSLSDNVIQVHFSNDEYVALVNQVFKDDLFTNITVVYGTNATEMPPVSYYCLVPPPAIVVSLSPRSTSRLISL